MLVAVLVMALWLACCVRLVRGRSSRTGAGVRAVPVGRSLPEGHRPPPGLGPISPSERFLTAETRRGLHELQLFLAEQAPA